MHSSTKFHQSTSNLFLTPNNIDAKQLYSKVIELGEAKCIEYLGEDIKKDTANFKKCSHNLATGITCIAIDKANTKVGDLRDHSGNCKYLITLANEESKVNFKNFPIEKYNEYLREISLSTKNIV